MAQTGQKYLVEIGSDKVGYMRTKAFNLTRETIDTSSDENPDYATSISGQRSATLSGEAILNVTDAGQAALVAAWESDEPVSMTFTSVDTPHIEITCDMFVNDVNFSAGTNEVVTASITAQSTGTITIDVVTP